MLLRRLHLLLDRSLRAGPVLRHLVSLAWLVCRTHAWLHGRWVRGRLGHVLDTWLLAHVWLLAMLVHCRVLLRRWLMLHW